MADISVVVVSLVGGQSLRDMLIELMRQCRSHSAECLLVISKEGQQAELLQQQFPDLRILDREARAVPFARQLGVEHASHDIVALLEDTSIPGSNWLVSVQQAFADTTVQALGGPVSLHNTLPARYLALGCGEYGRFHPDHYGDASSGITSVDRLPGNNLAYRRSALMAALAGHDDGLIEAAVNDQLLQQGCCLYVHPAMQVCYSARDEYGARLSTRFQHGRLYAGNRIDGQSMASRLVWALKAVLLPAVLSLRGWSNMRNCVAMTRWPAVMLWITLMESAWAIGEITGYLAGAGRSMESWQ